MPSKVNCFECYGAGREQCTHHDIPTVGEYDAIDRIRTLEAQRDELLAALVSHPHDRQVILKTKGEQC